MPRLLVRAKNHDRERSLGWLAVAWMEALVLHGRGDVTGQPIVMGDEYTGFIVDCYAVGEDGRRLYDSAFISRPKGCDKSGLAARIDLFEALGPCRTLRDEGGDAVFAEGGEVYRDPYGLGFEYVYSPGEPMGRHVQSPMIRCMATEEGQTGNVYDSVHYNLTEGPLSAVLDRADDAGLTRIMLPRKAGPRGGSIIPSTSGAASKDGGLETHASFDETHLYTTPELQRMYATVTRNLGKRRKIAETWFLESTTMYNPSQQSVAKETFKLAGLIQEGKVKRERLLLDHRWGSVAPEDLGDEKKLRAGLVDSYGDAAEWVDIDGLVDDILDPRSEVTDSIRYFLNDQATSESAWMDAFEWSARSVETLAEAGEVIPPPKKGDIITLGFDGSRSRVRGITDATALIATRVGDGLQWELGVWEQPRGLTAWEVPVAEVEATIDETFRDFSVVAFFADPAKWETRVAAWEAKYGKRLAVKSSDRHPIEWWMTGSSAQRTVRVLEQYRNAVIDGEMSHVDSPALTRHILAAHMKPSRSGVQIGKENPSSDRKIDAAVAAVLSWQARTAALAAGVGTKRRSSFVPSRIR